MMTGGSPILGKPHSVPFKFWHWLSFGTQLPVKTLGHDTSPCVKIDAVTDLSKKCQPSCGKQIGQTFLKKIRHGMDHHGITMLSKSLFPNQVLEA